MKLRIKGNSLRMRVTRPELEKLLNKGRVEETIYFATGEQSKLTYALIHEPNETGASARYNPPEIAIVLSTKSVREWEQSDQVGIYTEVSLGPRGALNLIVEKDFACLDRNDAENLDAFPNPNARGAGAQNGC